MSETIARKNVKTSKRQYKVLKIFAQLMSRLVVLLLVIICLINFTMIFQRNFLHESYPNFLGYTPFIVKTDSMTGTKPDSLNKGDLVVVKKFDNQALKVGQVVTFAEKVDQTVTHRVIKIDKNSVDGEIEKIYTQGDINPSQDVGYVTPKQLIGEYAFKIQKFGFFFGLIKSPAGLGTLAIIVVLLILFSRNDKGNRYEEKKQK